METETKEEATLVNLKYDAVNGLSFETMTVDLAINKENQQPPYARETEWKSHQYNLVDLGTTSTIVGIEELCVFIMDGGCVVQWEDESLQNYCLRNRHNFTFFARAWAWGTLSTNDDQVIIPVKTNYDMWIATGKTTPLKLKIESPGDFE